MVYSPTMTKRHANAPATAEPASYEAALAELDRLVQAMESAQLPLDQLLDSHRRGAELLGWCRQRLDAVEQQVKVLDNGQLKPWSDAA
jgi:exodeoxyribonuclease VII small subunit